MKKVVRKKEEDIKDAVNEGNGDVDLIRSRRREMCKKMLEFIDKSVVDETKELARYAPYEGVAEFVNPWAGSEVHGVSNDVAAILAALED
ncbi:hypothetical protein M970_050750 [Encephalitozoon cuniculi EcunIII-L]|nr:hypothetical protein M970_050750 [Encephalitozoon cuniculi EcunIII-L]UYI27869.1 hypothetical protein J0A71_08g17570 [Encephalitozoon cuniculi]